MAKIPEKHVEFARALGRLCKEHGLDSLSASFMPGVFEPGWHERIEVSWSQGRHGAEAGDVIVTATQRLRTQTHSASEQSGEDRPA